MTGKVREDLKTIKTGTTGNTQNAASRPDVKKAVGTVWTQFGHTVFSGDFQQMRASVIRRRRVRQENAYYFSALNDSDTKIKNGF
ncbi:MAG: hypothetical protein QNL70_00125 [Pseudomonas sp.]